MQIETSLLILESVLLAFTIALLIYSIKEGKVRKSLLLEVGRATKILTRQEYFLTVRDAMSEASQGFPRSHAPTRSSINASATRRSRKAIPKIIMPVPPCRR